MPFYDPINHFNPPKSLFRLFVSSFSFHGIIVASSRLKRDSSVVLLLSGDLSHREPQSIKRTAENLCEPIHLCVTLWPNFKFTMNLFPLISFGVFAGNDSYLKRILMLINLPLNRIVAVQECDAKMLNRYS
jgi:hypothetical protein